MTRFITFIWLLCLAAAIPVSAQTLPFRSYSIEQGLSESVVHDIYQDHNDFLWIATNHGLNRFDGLSFRHYHVEDGLRGNSVTNLFEDSENRLWVGTDRGVSVMRKDSLVTPSALTVLDDLQINDILRDRDGRFWFATGGNGVYVWTENERGLKHIGEEDGLIGNRVRAMEQARDGTLWLATREGLTRWQEGRMESYTTGQGLPNRMIRDIVLDEQDRLYIATRGGLSIFRNDRFTNYTERDGLVNDRIRSITLDPDGGLWLGTEEGLSYFNQGDFQNFTVEEGLPNEILYVTTIDREGNLWLGSFGGGLIRLTGRYFRNFTVEDGLPNDVITSFTEDEQGRAWISSYGGGVVRYDGENLAHISTQDGLVDDKVYTLTRDRQNRIWIGTRWGISVYENGKFTNLDERKMPHRKVRAIHQSLEDDELFWIGTYGGGLLRLENSRFTQYTREAGLPHNTVMDIVETSAGRLWLATYGGVSRYEEGSFTNYTTADGLPANGILDIEEDREGRLWFATFEGVAYYENGTFTSVTAEEVLTTSICYFIKQDRSGVFWIGTKNGVVRFQAEVYEEAESQEERMKAVKLINKSQGLVADEMNVGAVMESGDGSLWFGSVSGASRLLADRIKRQPVSPKVHIDDLRVAEEKVPLTEKGPLRFNSDENSLRFDYIGLSFQAPELVEYAYRLKGGEEQWYYTSERRVRYTALSPGSYTFEVRARNADGEWSEQTASTSFVIRAPFWWSWWFLILILFVFAGIIWLIYRYYRMKKQMEMEQMRVRIASDLHDDVGSALTEIALQSDFLQEYDHLDFDNLKDTLQQIGNQSRKIVSSLDDIVWSIDARNDTVGDLTDRMQDYAYHVLNMQNTDVRFNFDSLDMDKKLSVEKRENIYLIFKEAVNNIAKHSNADEVNISLVQENDGLALNVIDNGTGEKKSRKSGQGLRNMGLRAERVNAQLDIDRKDGFSVRLKGI